MNDRIQSGGVHTYTRVSKSDRDTGSISLQWQRDTIHDWLAARKLTAGYSYEDNGVSASVPLADRGAGAKMIANAIHDGDLIVVAKWDRLFRDVADFRTWLKLWLDHGISLVSCTDAIDCTTPIGRFCATIIVAAAELERAMIGERTEAAMSTRRMAGLRTTPVARYGFRFSPTGQTGRDGRQEIRVTENEYEQSVIRRIVDWRFRCCWSLRKIAAALDQAKIKPRNGEKWSHSSIADILGSAGLLAEELLTKIAQDTSGQADKPSNPPE